ncbi:MAG TPA: iron uptake porin [Candidatus Sericytochromatia bacterium]
MKSCLRVQKTASSALIFATLGCVATSLSPVQAAPDLSPTVAAPIESSNHKSPTSTDLSIAKTEVTPASSQPTVAVRAFPIAESASLTSGGNTSVKTTEKTASDLAVATPTQAFPIAESASPASGENTSVITTERTASDLAVATPTSPLTNLETVSGTTKAFETKVEDLRSPKHLEAQALPTEVNPAESMSPTGMPEASGELAEEDDPMGQVTNVTQLSDVQPSDWAYEALRSLVERYGCIAGYPDGTFKGNRAMTRYEFAAGVNSCLQQIERLIASSSSGLASRRDLETLQRLVNEFQPELATLRTRVDNLEGRTASLENRQFSTTTKLFGQAIFGVQGRSENSFDFFLDRFSDQGTSINLVDNVQLSLFTQFSPRTLLLTGLAAGNGNNNAIRLANYVPLSYESGTNNSVELSDLNVRHLFGSKFAVITGPLGVNPVNVFRGVNRVESAGSGPLSRFAQRNPIINIGGGSLPGNGAGIGFDWQLATRLSLQGVYSVNGAADPFNGGIFGGNEGTTTAGAQLVVSPTDKIDVSLQYLNSYSPSGSLGTGVGDDLLVLQNISSSGFLRAPIQTNAIGASVEWRLTPRFTIGGWGGYTTSDFKGGSGSVETLNWMAFLNFPDLLGEGNLAGIYVGQPPKITSSDVSSDGAGRNIPSFINRGDFLAGEGGQPDSTIHLEGFYRFRVSDNISVTPGVIVIFNPNQNSDNDTITIGAIRTTFSF